MLKRLEVHQFLLILPFEICMHAIKSICMYCMYIYITPIYIVTNYMIVTVSQSMKIK